LSILSVNPIFISASPLLSSRANTCLPVYTPNTTYEGCYVDSSNPRLLTGVEYSFPGGNSIEYCAFQCGYAGYSFAGVEYAEYVLSSGWIRICVFCLQMETELELTCIMSDNASVEIPLRAQGKMLLRAIAITHVPVRQMKLVERHTGESLSCLP
jgi:hypothetical protein